MHIGLAVGAANPSLSASDRLLADAFAELGAQTSALRWNADPPERFLSCDAVVLRATWDYQEDPAAFASWIRGLEQGGGRVFNSAALTVWNNDKRHIIELASKGANVPPTMAISRDAGLPGAAASLGGDVVVKPAWGGDGVGVRRADAGNVEAVVAGIAQEAPGRPIMMQPYLPEIVQGEWSLIFLGGEFAHAVLKRSAAGEFRVNSRFGGTRAAAEPTRRLIEDGERVLSILPETPLYARIDGVVVRERLLCTELELTDPSLFFDLAPQSARKLAALTLARL